MKKDAERGEKLDRLMEAANKEYQQGKSLPFPKGLAPKAQHSL